MTVAKLIPRESSGLLRAECNPVSDWLNLYMIDVLLLLFFLALLGFVFWQLFLSDQPRLRERRKLFVGGWTLSKKDRAISRYNSAAPVLHTRDPEQPMSKLECSLEKNPAIDPYHVVAPSFNDSLLLQEPTFKHTCPPEPILRPYEPLPRYSSLTPAHTSNLPTRVDGLALGSTIRAGPRLESPFSASDLDPKVPTVELTPPPPAYLKYVIGQGTVGRIDPELRTAGVC